MDISRLYWVIFWSIFSLASLIIFVGYQNVGIIIMLILGFFHLIVFHIAEKDFINIHIKIKGVIVSMFKIIIIAWKAKSIVASKLDIIIIDAIVVGFVATVVYLTYLTMAIISIAIIACFFFIKKLYKPRLKTFQ